MYDPQRGCITVDGMNLKEINLKTFHGVIGYVSQDTMLSFGTVRDNLTYGLPWTATNGEIEEAARAANCLEFIEEMEDGFDAHLGEGGIKLSGGQRQRLAIARAFLRKPRLLIMDEASSHLDSENERLVQEGIDNLIARQGHTCTVIIIAHRLSTVKHADIIAVLQNGKVIEQGSHAALLEREDGVYAKMVAKQEAKAANVI
jgi:ATP-binding cassette subfamily B protein